MDNIIPLFSTPIFYKELKGVLTPDLLYYLKNLEYEEMSNARAESFTKNKNVLDLPICLELKKEILNQIKTYTNILSTKNMEFFILNSWINCFHHGGGANMHIHTNSLISGVFYLEINEGSGDLIIHKDFNQNTPFPSAVDIEFNESNIYNSKAWAMPPKTNMLFLFPSSTVHSVNVNKSSTDRYSLAFNVYAKGKLKSTGISDLIL